MNRDKKQSAEDADEVKTPPPPQHMDPSRTPAPAKAGKTKSVRKKRNSKRG